MLKRTKLVLCLFADTYTYIKYSDYINFSSKFLSYLITTLIITISKIFLLRQTLTHINNIKYKVYPATKCDSKSITQGSTKRIKDLIIRSGTVLLNKIKDRKLLIALVILSHFA